MLLAGRGAGKTRTAAEHVANFGLTTPNRRIGIVVATFGDGRDTCVEGESGLLRCIPDEDVAVWNRSLGELVLANGTRMRIFSCDQPDRLRGPQHHLVWWDEAAACDKNKQEEVYAQVRLGLRLPPDPKLIITTTPRPTKLIKMLVNDPATRVTKGSTFDNAANLAPEALKELRRLYEGTRIGRQELYAEVLSASEDAIIKPDWWGVWKEDTYPDGDFTVASLDSAYTENKENDASVLTVWRVYEHNGLSRILLIHAWKKRIEFNALVELLIKDCTRLKVDRLYVEGKANGLSVIQELRRRTREQRWVVHQVNPKGDKIARAHAISGVFAAGIVYAPDRKWSQEIIEDCSEFPISGRDSMDSVSQGISEIRRLGLNLFADEDDFAKRQLVARERAYGNALY